MRLRTNTDGLADNLPLVNADTKLYIGLPASTSDVSDAYIDDFLTPTTALEIINEYQSHRLFGGVMLWEATGARETLVYDQDVPSNYNFPGGNVTYFGWIKDYCLQPYASTTTSTAVTSTTTS